MRTLRVLLLMAAALLIVQGCEDDPILEPTSDDTGGGSYGKMYPLTDAIPADLRRANPQIF